MYKKAILFIFWLCLSVCPGFSQLFPNDLQNDLDAENLGIYDNLYLNKNYTYRRTWYDKNPCNISASNVKRISWFPENLENNSIYVLNTGNVYIEKTIIIGDCVAIIGSWALIDNSLFSWDIFIITWKYSIIDNIQISWISKEWQYGIKIINTDSITLHNIKINWLYGWIYSHNSNYSIYSWIQIHGIWDYSFYLENSSFNDISDVKSSNNNYEWLNLENASSNILENIELFDNSFQWLYLWNSSNNNISHLNTYWNGDAWIFINNWWNNKLTWIKSFFNTNDGILISSSQNEVDGILSHQNANWIEITSSGNRISNYYAYNNSIDGIFVKWDSNSFVSGLIYNNNKNWVELEQSSENTFLNIKIFNNWINENWIGYCWIRLYNKSNDNRFKNIYLFNNIFWICLNTNVSNSAFEDMKIFNNNRNESSNWKLTWNIFSWVITTFDLTKAGNSSEKTTKTGVHLNLIELKTWDKISLSWFNIIKPGISLIQRIVKPSFDYMVNPHVGDIYLYSWKSEYSDIIWYNPEFLNIKNEIPEYSVGIMLQDEITGHIISNWINVVSDWNINSYNIMRNEYVWNNLRNTLNENINTWDIRHTVATNINWKDVHAMLVLDIDAPICKIVYSTTGSTTENVIAYLTWCSEEIAWTDSSYPFNENWEYTFKFTDLVWNSWSATANVSRIKPKPVWGGGWWGGGWWWGWANSETISTGASSNTWNSNTKFNFNTWAFDSNYSDEMNMAYQHAYHFKITTQKSISEAWMDQALTRIAMAKMLSMYAMNVLWKKPANTIVPNFEDISEDLNEQYDYWISLAYQLWIMWINMPENKFRPHDLVTRAEFATALSRLLYWTADWNEFYYSTHLNKLFEKWIIVNTNPSLQELRWYVMIMLMRSAMWISSTEDFVYPEPETETQEIVRYFTEPYKKGQIYSRIWDLQDLLRYLGYYKLWTNYVYSKATINAVYDFQVAMWLIDADDISNPARWYLWPETRNALNEKWAEFQQYKNWIANEWD